jgi:hypothetical protein
MAAHCDSAQTACGAIYNHSLCITTTKWLHIVTSKQVKRTRQTTLLRNAETIVTVKRNVRVQGRVASSMKRASAMLFAASGSATFFDIIS